MKPIPKIEIVLSIIIVALLFGISMLAAWGGEKPVKQLKSTQQLIAERQVEKKNGVKLQIRTERFNSNGVWTTRTLTEPIPSKPIPKQKPVTQKINR